MPDRDGIIQYNLTLQKLKKEDRKRLEFIKAAHKTTKKESERREDYLEIISELVELKGYATTLDISRYMNVSPPSVTKMLQKLDEKGYLEYEKYHGINLTEKGNKIAHAIRQKHGILLDFFEILGVGSDTANQDAEGIEHHLNPKTIRQLRKFITFLKSNPKITDEFNEFQIQSIQHAKLWVFLMRKHEINKRKKGKQLRKKSAKSQVEKKFKRRYKGKRRSQILA